MEQAYIAGIPVYHDGTEPERTREPSLRPDVRALRALAAAELRVHREAYILDAPPTMDPTNGPRHRAPSSTEENPVWSRLVPRPTGSDDAAFGLIGLHFGRDADHDRVVAWLTTYLERRFGTEPRVHRGVTALRGGVSLYYGFPLELRSEMAKELIRLRRSGAALAFAWFA